MEFALGLSRFNRRMHGKVWIVDGRLAILGGRNIGDTYFGAPGTGARLSQDADMILAGPKLEDVSAVFDSFWNMGLSLPLLTLWPRLRINDKRFRRRLARHASAPLASAFRKQAIAGRSAAEMLAQSLRWTDDVTLLADPPDKALGRRKGPWLLDSIAEVMANARSRVRVTTPYFVPGSGGLALLTALARRGVKLQILTMRWPPRICSASMPPIPITARRFWPPGPSFSNSPRPAAACASARFCIPRFS